MNTDIEWLFEEVYKIQFVNPNNQLFFLSDWDSEIQESTDFSDLLKESYNRACQRSFKYSFAYEQFNLKQEIAEFASSFYDLKIPLDCLTLMPTATQAIYLSIKALNNLGKKRYLVFSPAYFATINSLNETGSYIDYSKLEQIILHQFIDCIILTDPVFSAGIEFSNQDYENFSRIIEKFNIFLLVDYSLGGLHWNTNELAIFNYNKLRELLKTDNFLFIDSLSKRLQLNGIKFSLVLGSSSTIDEIDTLSENIYGGLNSIQVEIISKLYSHSSFNVILDMHKRHLNKIQANYRLIKTFLSDYPYTIAKSNSGSFTIIYHNNLTFNDIDTKSIILDFLRNDKIIVIPNNRFSYFDENQFGWRINLSKKPQELIPAIGKCIGKIFSTFNK